MHKGRRKGGPTSRRTQIDGSLKRKGNSKQPEGEAILTKSCHSYNRQGGGSSNEGGGVEGNPLDLLKTHSKKIARKKADGERLSEKKKTPSQILDKLRREKDYFDGTKGGNGPL